MRFNLVEELINSHFIIEDLLNIKYIDVTDTTLIEHNLSRDIINNIPQKLTDTGKIDIRDEKIETYEDLAIMCRMFRDTRVESFRIIFMKDDIVVGSRGVSANLPDTSSVIHYHTGDDNDTLCRAANDYVNTYRRTNANGFYMCHNHPSGNVDLSEEDMRMTVFFAGWLPNFLGHIIVGKQKYSILKPNGERFTDTFDGDSYSDNMTNEQIGNADEGINYMNTIDTEDDSSYILYMDVNNQLICLEELKLSAYNDSYIFSYIRNRRIDLGSPKVYIYTENKDYFLNKFQTFTLPSYIKDILLYSNGKVISRRQCGKLSVYDDVIKRYNL